jgi:integrase
MDGKLTGITANNSSIQIAFTYNGMRCREIIKVKPTKSSLKQAQRKREAVLDAIAWGQFDYLKHFPNSKKGLELANRQACNITISQMINGWFKRNQSQWEYSTMRGYISKIDHHIEPNFGNISVSNFKPSLFKDWGATSTLSGKKSKNDVRSIMHSAFQELYIDEIIESNPMTRVKRFKHIKAEPEPFNSAEREKILAKMTGHVRNLYEFAFWTGLRTSELLALRRCHIDLERKVVFVRDALVKGKIKGTKTTSGKRTVQLHEKALTSLNAQLKLLPLDQERIFINPKTMLPWKNDRATYNSAWSRLLKNLV